MSDEDEKLWDQMAGNGPPSSPSPTDRRPGRRLSTSPLNFTQFLLGGRRSSSASSPSMSLMNSAGDVFQPLAQPAGAGGGFRGGSESPGARLLPSSPALQPKSPLLTAVFAGLASRKSSQDGPQDCVMEDPKAPLPAAVDPAESSVASPFWMHPVPNLDSFYNKMYNFYYEGGFLAMLARRATHLL